MRVPSSRRFPSTGRSPRAAARDRRCLRAQRRARLGEVRETGIAASTPSTTAAIVPRSMPEPRRELPLRNRVRHRLKVAHPGEVQPPGRRGEDVGVGDQTSGHLDWMVRFAPAMMRTLRSAMKPLTLKRLAPRHDGCRYAAR